MPSVVYSALLPADGAWSDAVGALLDRLQAQDTAAGATVAVKIDLTAETPPALVAALVAALKANGAEVFVTDCAPFEGSPLAAFDQIRARGLTPDVIGADFVLADGVKGSDYDLIPMRGGKFLRSTKVGRALSDADCIVTLSRCVCTEEDGWRGVLHAVGFGCGAHPGKVDMLTTGQPVVDPDKCIGCGQCTTVCEHGGTRIDPETGKAFIFKPRCAGCSRCMRVCPADAIHPDYNATDERVRMKIAEVAKSMCDHRTCLHLALTPDALLAAPDPTALDALCADLMHVPEALRTAIDHADGMRLGSKDYVCERV